MAGKILVIGSSCVDVILQLDHLPVTEEDMHPRSQSFRLGGCAYNVANILGKAGADVTFVTPVGLKGIFGPYVLRGFEEQPWVHPVLLPGEENGCCYCLVESSGERTFLSVHGAEYTFSSSWMEEVMDRKYDLVYVSGLEIEERTGMELVTFLEGLQGTEVFYAPGPRVLRIDPERQRRILALHPVLHLNRTEACALAGEEDPEKAALLLQGRTGNCVTVTCGRDGAVGVDRTGKMVRVPAMEAKVVDTIGAGDAHAGILLCGLAGGWDFRKTLETANRISAQVVSVEGASLDRETVLRVLQSAGSTPGETEKTE